ncbi:MAG: DUF429 domain-containing protein [Candidatus Bilamarchaeaceae archaeon]
MMLMGVDLAGCERRPSGWAVLYRKKLYFGVVNSDNEIISLIKKYKIKKVLIDAPLSLPAGRASIDKKGKQHFRECDLLLRKEGIRFFPITLGPMRMLTKRGMDLKKKLERFGVEVFEGFPGASYDRLGIPRKDKRKILAFLKKVGFPSPKDASQDELDALILLFTLVLKEKGLCRNLSGKDGEIIAPAILR